MLKRSPGLDFFHSELPASLYSQLPATHSMISGAPVLNVRLEGSTTPTDFFGAVGQRHAVADALSVEVDAGLGVDTDVVQLRIAHGESVEDLKPARGQSRDFRSAVYRCLRPTGWQALSSSGRGDGAGGGGCGGAGGDLCAGSS